MLSEMLLQYFRMKTIIFFFNLQTEKKIVLDQ